MKLRRAMHQRLLWAAADFEIAGLAVGLYGSICGRWFGMPLLALVAAAHFWLYRPLWNDAARKAEEPKRQAELLD